MQETGGGFFYNYFAERIKYVFLHPPNKSELVP